MSVHAYGIVYVTRTTHVRFDSLLLSVKLSCLSLHDVFSCKLGNISYFSPVTGLFRKYVHEAMHGRLNFTTTKKCHSLTIRNVSDITPPPTLLLSTWESKRVISECTHHPGLCIAVDPQTTKYHRTIVAPPPPSSWHSLVSMAKDYSLDINTGLCHE